MEKHILGLYVSGHPLDNYTEVIREKTSTTLAELTEEQDQQRIILGGMINNFKINTTKRGATMATCQFEDLTGSIDMLVFPKTFVRYREKIQKDAIVLVKGRYLAQEDNAKISADEILPLPDDAQWKAQKAQSGNSAAHGVMAAEAQERAPYPESASYSGATYQAAPAELAPQVASLQEIAAKRRKKLYLRLAGDHCSAQTQQKLKQILRQYQGDMPVYFYFSEDKKMVLAEYQFWVNTTIDLIMALSQLLGAENISVKEQKQEETE